MSGERTLGLRDGWLSAGSAVALGAATAAIVAATATTFSWLVVRGALAGLVVLVLGVVVGSERIVGLSAAPMLAAALVGVTSTEDLAWGHSMLVGCLWYVSLELAWASIGQRDGSRRSPAVGRQRLREVATVVLLAIVVSSLGAVASALAPTRTLTLRAAVIAVVLLALVSGVRHLLATAPPDPGQVDSSSGGGSALSRAQRRRGTSSLTSS